MAPSYFHYALVVPTYSKANASRLVHLIELTEGGNYSSFPPFSPFLPSVSESFISEYVSSLPLCPNEP